MNLNTDRYAGPSGQSGGGFLIIETMVAMAVLSIALLSLTGMQLTGLRNNHSAMLRSEAVIAVEDVADRMRGNLSGVRAGQYTFNGNTGYGTPANQAQRDINGVLNFLAAHHNDNLLSIACDGSLAFVANCSISIFWEDSRAVGPRQEATTVAGKRTSFTTNVFL